MAGIYNEDESTDEEFGMNLHLAERLRINRSENSNFSEDKPFENSKDFKQYCNMRRKKFAQEGQSSSSSSVDAQTDNSTSLLPCSDMYHNKKRQNGDKNTEQLATKRTCHRSPDWREFKKKANNHSTKPDYFISATSTKLQHHKNSRDRVNGFTDDDDDSDFEIPRKMNGHAKIKTGCEGSSKPSNSHSSPNHCKRKEQTYEMKPSTSYINFFLSSSEDESKSVAQNGALKGGRPGSSTDLTDYFTNRLIGRKLSKKLLDSDDSEDEKPTTSYRTKPLVFSSSDSDEFEQNDTKVKHNSAASNESAGHSHFYSNGFDKGTSHPSRQFKPFRSNQKFSKKAFCTVAQSRPDNSEGCDRQFLSSDFQRKSIPHRPCRSRRVSRINVASTLTPNGFVNGGNVGGAVRGRRVGASERGRRSGSPHHRSNRYQHKLEDSKCRGRSISAPHSQKEMPSYAVRYPDVFDAEESENEYFTANSYSDTEASTEFLGGLSINTTFPSHGTSISCTVSCDGSTDDEISVVFSTRPHGRSNDSSRDTVTVEEDITFTDVPYGMSNDPSVTRADDEISVIYSTAPYSRNNETRQGVSRTLGRRRNRGILRQLQNSREVVSLSPDPVEQVRQVEEDERMARILQAQFDAEVDADYVPPPSDSVRFIEADNDEDDEDENTFDPVTDTDDSDEPTNPRIYPWRRFPIGRRGFASSRFQSPRADSPMSIFLTNSPNQVNWRRTHSGSTRHQESPLSRFFGIGLNDILGFMGDSDADYETLLGLDMDGDIYPRGLAKTDINRLPTRQYIHPNSAASSSGTEVTHKRAELNKECQVCLTDYETGDTLRILPCFHEFHTPCIDPWLSINHTCPVCRVRVDLDA